MKNLYYYLEQRKNDETIIYEIVNDENLIEYKKTIEAISKLDINPKYKKFYIEQLSYKTGKYSYKDLYELVNYYINKLKTDKNCPYQNFYPILLREKTYIDNIALFIACLNLNLKPVCIELDFIKELKDEPNIIEDHSFGVCSSGSIHKKLISLSEQIAIKKKIESSHQELNTHDEEQSIFYCITNIASMSGLDSIIFNPLILGSKSIINTKENFFEEISKRKVTHAMLPLDFQKFMNKPGQLNLDFSNIKSLILSGGYVCPRDLYDLTTKLDLRLDQIVLAYAQTENYGVVTSTTANGVQHIDVYIGCDKSNKLCLNVYDDFYYMFEIDGIYNDMTKINRNFVNGKQFITNEDIPKNIIHFLSMGKTDKNAIKIERIESLSVNEKIIGEIIVNNKRTGDIGYIDDYGELYVLFKKDNPKSLIANYIKCRYLPAIILTDNINEILEENEMAFDQDYISLANIYYFYTIGLKKFKTYQLVKNNSLNKIQNDVDGDGLESITDLNASYKYMSLIILDFFDLIEINRAEDGKIYSEIIWPRNMSELERKSKFDINGIIKYCNLQTFLKLHKLVENDLKYRSGGAEGIMISKKFGKIRISGRMLNIDLPLIYTDINTIRTKNEKEILYEDMLKENAKKFEEYIETLYEKYLRGIQLEEENEHKPKSI